MVNKSQIIKTFARIENLYQKHVGNYYRGQYFAKLAIIEACGWIEESMDDIVRRCTTRYLNDLRNIRSVEGDIIKNTHSFKYDPNFRNMLIQVLGLINVERLELTYDQNKFVHMSSSLDILKQRRDDQAHTYVKGTTPVIDAPSITKDRFLKAYDGLKDIEA